MEERISNMLNGLINEIANLDKVSAIGISGKLRPFPLPGKGDFDIFVYCDEIPKEKTRLERLSKVPGIENIGYMGKSDAWGNMDFCTIENIETFVMYFKKADVLKNTEDIVKGKYLWKLDNGYFPIGRVAMLASINILYDRDGFLSTSKKVLKLYPGSLKEKMIAFHTSRMLDPEDFERAISRKDILFYHSVLDTAIEHFLMALFAMNETYFPSRKKSSEYIDRFNIKPNRCIERLQSVIKDSVVEEKMDTSYINYLELCDELIELSGLR